MAIKVIEKNKRTERPVNDRIVIRHLVARGSEFIKIILKYQDVIEGISPAEENHAQQSIDRTVYLDRPDTLEEDEINHYTARANALQKELNQISLSINFYLHDFSTTA